MASGTGRYAYHGERCPGSAGSTHGLTSTAILEGTSCSVSSPLAYKLRTYSSLRTAIQRLQSRVVTHIRRHLGRYLLALVTTPLSYLRYS